MIFSRIEVLRIVQEIYRIPRSRERFEKYLTCLHGENKEDIEIPIASFNPMGKELAARKLNELIEFETEHILQEEIDHFNSQNSGNQSSGMQLAINLSDDIDGAWSNYYTTDYQSKFDFNDMMKLNYGIIHFYTCETFNPAMIRRRIQEYISRFDFAIHQKLDNTLGSLFAQEFYVQRKVLNEKEINANNMDVVESFFEENKESSAYDIIFNFFYNIFLSSLKMINNTVTVLAKPVNILT